MAKGFFRPSDEDENPVLNLHRHLVAHPAATFFMRAAGSPARETGIAAGDLLVVDRSLAPDDGRVVVVAEEGELRLERFARRPPAAEKEVWGVVTWIIRRA